MATYTFNFDDGQFNSVTGAAWLFIGGTASVNSDIPAKIPRYSIINSASCTIDLKRDGTSSLSMYNHDGRWAVQNSSNTDSKVLWSSERVIARDYKTFTQDILSYVNSNNADAGLMRTDLGYRIIFGATGDLSKTYTWKNRKLVMTYTPPTIKIVGAVNDSAYGKVTTDGSFTLGNSIDIDAGDSIRAEIYAMPNDGYKFVAWSDGRTENWREVEISEDVLTAHDTTLTYTAIFEKEETSNIFIGNQRVSAYLGTQKVSVYIGTQKLS